MKNLAEILLLPRKTLDRLVVLLGFLTAIPVPSSLWPRETVAMSRALPLSPLIGLVMGGIVGLGLSFSRSFLPPLPSASLALGLYLILGWSLHMDGLADLADGWGSHKRGEAMREIMKDSRIGGHGTLALICALLIWTSLAGAIPGDRVLLLLMTSAATGRFALVLASALGTYPWEKGMGKEVVENTGWREVSLAGLITLIALPLFPLGILCATAASGLVVWGMARFARTVLGGSNGDVLGATEVLAELTALAVLTALVC
jgi:adenosylcobinamide-GDP ribazoletransferase